MSARSWIVLQSAMVCLPIHIDIYHCQCCVIPVRQNDRTLLWPRPRILIKRTSKDQCGLALKIIFFSSPVLMKRGKFCPLTFFIFGLGGLNRTRVPAKHRVIDLSEEVICFLFLYTCSHTRQIPLQEAAINAAAHQRNFGCPWIIYCFLPQSDTQLKNAVQACENSNIPWVRVEVLEEFGEVYSYFA